MLSLLSKNIRTLARMCELQLQIATLSMSPLQLVQRAAGLMSQITSGVSGDPDKKLLHIPARAKPTPSPDVDTVANTTSDAVETPKQAEDVSQVKKSSPANQTYMKGYQNAVLTPEQKQMQKLKTKLYLEMSRNGGTGTAEELSLAAAVNRQLSITGSSLQVAGETDGQGNLIKTKVETEAEPDTPEPIKASIFDDTARIMGNARSSVYSIFRRAKPTKTVHEQQGVYKVEKRYKKNKLPTLSVKMRPYPKVHVPLPSYSEYVKTNAATPRPKPSLAELHNFAQPTRHLQPTERFLSEKPRFGNAKGTDTLLVNASKQPLRNNVPLPSYSEHVKTNTAPPPPKPSLAALHNFTKPTRYLQPNERFLSEKRGFGNANDIDIMLASASRRPLPNLQSRDKSTQQSQQVPLPSYSEHVKTNTAPPPPKPSLTALHNFTKQARYLQPNERFLSEQRRFGNTKDIDTLLTSVSKRPLPNLQSRDKTTQQGNNRQLSTRIKSRPRRAPVQDKNRYALTISKTVAESNFVKGKGGVFF